jgi:hypothetical protein
MKRFSITALIALMAFALPASANAADAKEDAAAQARRGFTVAPLSLTDIRLSPGQTITGTLQVFTYGGGKSFEVSVGEAAQASDGSYILKRLDDKDPQSVANWIEAGPKTFESGPGDTEPINWTVSVPTDAAPGDYVGLIYIRRLSEASENTQRVNVEYATRVEITVLGDVNFNPVIEQVGVPGLSNGDNFTANVRLTNRGNVRLDLDNANARVEFVVDGKVRKRYRLEGVIYPDVSRVWKFTWGDPPRFAHAKTRVVIDFPEQGDRPSTTVKREATSWILPYRELFFAIFIGGALLALGLIALRNRRREDEVDELDVAGPAAVAPVVSDEDSHEMRVVAPPVEEQPVEQEEPVVDVDDEDYDPYDDPNPPRGPFGR